jgi:hypothetical protein
VYKKEIVMDRREFMKLSALIGGGLMVSSFTFGDNMGYFKMERPAQFIYYGDGMNLNEKFIFACTYNVKSFEDFISKNWDKTKSIFVYDVINESMNDMKYVRAAVLDIPYKSINDKMCFDRKFTYVNAGI